MSYVTIYEVTKSGDIVQFATERNAMAWAPVVWVSLMAKYLPGLYWWNKGEVEQLWAMMGTDKLEGGEADLLALTFDRVWVKRERFEHVTKILRGFFGGLEEGIDSTIPRIADAIERLARERPDALGFALHGTSVSSPLWDIVDRDGELVRRVNVLTAPTCADGKSAWEIGDP